MIGDVSESKGKEGKRALTGFALVTFNLGNLGGPVYRCVSAC